MSARKVLRAAAVVFSCLVLAAHPSQAQAFVAEPGSGGGGGLASMVVGLTESVVKLLRVFLGLGALISVVTVAFKIMGGDREALRRYAWWIIGLAYGEIMLTVLSKLVGNVSAGMTSAGDFAAYHMEVKGVVVALLCFVCMITLVKGLYAVMRGHRESVQTTFGWTLSTVVLMTVISVI